jgi:ABC-type spermidine/putrescine transport system permease subunit I
MSILQKKNFLQKFFTQIILKDIYLKLITSPAGVVSAFLHQNFNFKVFWLLLSVKKIHQHFKMATK